ncbi:chemotaxis protein CheB [Pedobacter hiemivivus]|uniref:protein-glutamate methylesterase n=1 Tax=Pedobacter hiemivivus TaxID=2530454 RepID=A0A4V2MJX7_9SPHI|nr:chemotaxis protein CheB [Pedobacter hiemivivus]TCC96016.1 chemotaxis protein CheB [Pedobacter hiemivivus]TKC65527.1 chemotaxis protein CheB [Pedobacter hiemivivus]
MKITGKKIAVKDLDRLIVIGTSAGGLEALKEFVEHLPIDFPAPILVVMHISADATGNILIDTLNTVGKLTCLHATDGMQAKSAHIYFAPPDHHMLIDSSGKLMVTKGAQENRYRPGIDPLFRSAAVAYGNRAIGIVLTGYLDDGTAGLMAIDRCGGICIVQDPSDAEYPDMPNNALGQVRADFKIPISQMGVTLTRILLDKLPKEVKIPKDIVRESEIAERVLSDLPSVNALGDQVPFNCPGCGGVLWQISEGPLLRFRCHTGHSYTAKALISEQTKKIEETMWTALRMFEERRNLLTTFSKSQSGASAKSSMERAEASQVHIDRIRKILKSDNNGKLGNMPD